MNERPRNNFEALRWIAASSVVFAHAYTLQNDSIIFNRIFRLELGWCAVIVFFTISGYLIAGSAVRRDALSFWSARCLRIFPGLIVCTIAVALALSFITTLPSAEYLINRQTLRFIFGTGTLISTEYGLPGVFDKLPYHWANGSLWSLRYELLCYAWIFAISLMSRRWAPAFPILLGLSVASVVAAYLLLVSTGRAPLPLENLSYLMVAFGFGALVAWSKRRGLPLWSFALACALAALLWNTPLKASGAALAIACLTLWLAFVPNLILGSVSRLPDYSYGIYIYAYPIQQLILTFMPGLDPLAKAVLAWLLTLVPAALSWHLVESRAVALKSVRRTRHLPQHEGAAQEAT